MLTSHLKHYPYIIYRDTPVASLGDQDVGVPFQGHGTCLDVGCLLFTAPVVLCVIQPAD